MARITEAFTVTYSLVTPESAEYGDHAEHGFVVGGNYFECERERVELEREHGEPGWREHWPPASCRMTLREALRLVGCCEDSGRWFTETDERIDYATGDSVQRSLHCPKGITASSYARVRRLLCC